MTDEISFDFDEWEAEFVNKFPDVAREMCRIDDVEAEKNHVSYVSKRKMKQTRENRLSEMMIDGRSLYESTSQMVITQEVEKQLIIDNSCRDDKISMIIRRAIKTKSRIEISLSYRQSNRIDCIITGIPLAVHAGHREKRREKYSILLRDVIETRLERKSKNKRAQKLIPPFLRWKPGGNWPINNTKGQLVHRTLKSVLIRGKTIANARLI